MPIILFSRPIRSGKSTELKNALPYMGKAGGIISPDIEELRYTYAVSRGTFHPLQSVREIEGETLNIGRFYFFHEGFEMARTLLEEGLNDTFDTFIVDEIGKLEMHRKEGLEPTIGNLIQHYKNPKVSGDLILVIRDFMVEELISHYALDTPKIVSDLNEWMFPKS